MIDTAWHYRLFFSVDIENSTSFKYSKIFKAKDDSRDVKSADWQWGAVFRDFFDSFIDAFFTKNRKNIQDQKPNGIDFHELEIWKFLGDEIIFVVDITDVRAVLWHVYAFKNAIKFYNGIENKGKDNLRCKGTIWGAGFPINNFPLGSKDTTSEDDFIQKKNEILKREYVGANIDAGFRLTKFSSPRNMVVSIEVAYFLSMSWNSQKGNDATEDKCFPKMKYSGMKILKGIFFNNPYPVFFVDLQYQVPPFEDHWLGLERECQPDEIIDFCKHYFDKATFFSTPFIADDKSGVCGTVPQELEDRRQKLIEGLKQDYDFKATCDGTENVDSSGIDERFASLEN